SPSMYPAFTWQSPAGLVKSTKPHMGTSVRRWEYALKPSSMRAIASSTSRAERICSSEMTSTVAVGCPAGTLVPNAIRDALRGALALHLVQDLFHSRKPALEHVRWRADTEAQVALESEDFARHGEHILSLADA